MTGINTARHGRLEDGRGKHELVGSYLHLSLFWSREVPLLQSVFPIDFSLLPTLKAVRSRFLAPVTGLKLDALMGESTHNDWQYSNGDCPGRRVAF